MAKCWKCHKRCRADMRCLWCGRGPICLACACDCRLWPEGQADASGRPICEHCGLTVCECRSGFEGDLGRDG